jgi:hypothetical protein
MVFTNEAVSICEIRGVFFESHFRLHPGETSSFEIHCSIFDILFLLRSAPQPVGNIGQTADLKLSLYIDMSFQP